MKEKYTDFIHKSEKHIEMALKNKEMSLKILEKLINLSSHLDISDSEKYKIYSEAISSLSKVAIESDFLIKLNKNSIEFYRKRLEKI
jgi:hypothetical protein